jgi:hypothetical protein
MSIWSLLATDAVLVLALLAAIGLLVLIGQMFERVAVGILGPQSELPHKFNLLFLGAWSAQATEVALKAIGTNHGWWS